MVPSHNQASWSRRSAHMCEDQLLILLKRALHGHNLHDPSSSSFANFFRKR
jgi:hypothetical protein